jgi:hypothetical protein
VAAIKVEQKVTPSRLKELGVEGWSPWECAPETFDWEYGSAETAYVMEGRVRVRTEQGEVVEFGQGDVVHFPGGLKCTWTVLEHVRKVYTFT